MIRLLLLSVLPCLCASLASFAQCIGAGGIPFNCAPAGALPGSTDMFLGGKQSGYYPVRWTGARVFGMDHSAAPATGITNTVSPINPLFGAKCDGTTDDSTAFAAWWTYLASHNVEGLLPPGTCVINSPQTWNMAGHNGLKVIGAGNSVTTLDLRGVRSGVPLLLTGGGTSIFYGEFAGFQVLTNIAGPGVEIGALGGSDAFNGFVFRQIQFKNVANNSAAVALQLNGVYNCDFQAVTTNTGGGLTPPAVGGASAGVSLELRTASFSRFMGSFSGAETGIHITGGFNFSNVFEAVDVEVVNRAVVIDSANASRNTFVGGQFVGLTLFDFQAGVANLIENPNPGIYSGGAITAGVAGMYLQLLATGVITPAVAATGVATTNATGRVIAVTVHNDPGGLTQILVNGSTLLLTSGTVVLQPNDTITLTYASGTPSWLWKPIL